MTAHEAINYIESCTWSRTRLGLGRTRELLSKLVCDAPEAIKWLNELGVEFDKTPDGTMVTTHGGGTSRKRMHAAKDYSGAEIMRTLRDEVLNRGIPVVDFTSAIELILDENGNAAGAVLMNMETKELMVARAKTVIIATGGAGRMHYQGFPTSNHYGATADGLVLAYRVGSKLLYADSLQVVGKPDFNEICRIAGQLGGSVAYRVDSLNRLDQWIPFGYLTKEFPIYKFSFEDDARQEMYISSKSGKVLQWTDRNSRFWAWLGAIPHWVYFTSLRQNQALWINFMIWASGLGAIMCFSGLWIGIWVFWKNRKTI